MSLSSGISMAVTQRSEFASIHAAPAAVNYGGLIAMMREKAASAVH